GARVARIEERLAHRTQRQLAACERRDAVAGDLDVARREVASRRATAVLQRGDERAPDAAVGIDDEVARPRQREHEPLDQLDRELARMLGLFGVRALDVRDLPYVARVLAERIAR